MGRFKKVLPSKAYEKWESEARVDVLRQLAEDFRPFKIISGPVHVGAIFYYKGVQPDLSGCLESVGDCLEGIIWENDRLIKSWDGSRLIHELVNPYTVVTVEW
jgi:Holliday junction resolvase RusA-like endonuclease